LIPIIPKFFLRSKSEYYGIKKRIYTGQVVDQYQSIKSELLRLYDQQYQRYSSYTNSKQEMLYADPPFNTKKIDLNEFYLDEDDFKRLTICTKEGDPE
jgi:16S rRNA G966 N2-methylase RsmD